MNKTLIKHQHLKVNPIPPELVLTASNKNNIGAEIKNYFLDKRVFTLFNPVILDNLKMTSHLEIEGGHVNIYLFLFGTKGEILMKEYTYFSHFDTEVNEIPLFPNPWDIFNPMDKLEIISFAFATKDDAAQISFHLEEKIKNLKKVGL